MSDDRKEYKRLDLSKIKFGKIISMEEALKDVEPVAWSDDVLAGKYRDKVLVQ